MSDWRLNFTPEDFKAGEQFLSTGYISHENAASVANTRLRELKKLDDDPGLYQEYLDACDAIAQLNRQLKGYEQDKAELRIEINRLTEMVASFSKLVQDGQKMASCNNEDCGWFDYSPGDEICFRCREDLVNQARLICIEELTVEK